MNPLDILDQVISASWCAPYEVDACRFPLHKGPCKGTKSTARQLCTGTGKNRRCKTVTSKKTQTKVGKLNPRQRRAGNSVAPRTVKLPSPRGSSTARKVRRSHTASAGGPMPVTLTIAGKPLSFTAADPLGDLFGPLSFCRHPIVHPGPCKGWKGTAKKTLTSGRRKAKAKDKPVATAKAAVKAPAKGKGKGGPASGKPGLYQSLPYEQMAQLPTDNNRLDEQLRAIGVAQGFDAHPRVVADRADLDALEAAGGTRLFRGIGDGGTKSGATLAEELRSGPIFYGQNARGNGIVTDTAKTEALRKAGNNADAMVEMVLPAEARVATREELTQLGGVRAKQWAARQDFLLEQVRKTTDPAARAKALATYENWRRGKTGRDSVLADPGRLAAALGFDAIADRDPATGKLSNVTVLNRGALVALDNPNKPKPTIPTTQTPSASQPSVPSVGAPTSPVVNTPIKRVEGTDLTDKIDYTKFHQLSMNNNQNDDRLSYLGELHGFDGQPTLVSTKDMDDLVASGHQQVFRGIDNYYDSTKGRLVKGSEMADQFRTGKMFYGQGIYGNGVYASTDRRTAVNYSQGHGYAANPTAGLLRIALAPDAKVMTLREALDGLKNERTPDQTKLVNDQLGILRDMAKTRDVTERDKLLKQYQAASAKLSASPGSSGQPTNKDASGYAMRKGYDALKVPQHGEDYYVILNRTAVAVEDPNAGKAPAPKPSAGTLSKQDHTTLSAIDNNGGYMMGGPNSSHYAPTGVNQTSVRSMIKQGLLEETKDAYGNDIIRLTDTGQKALRDGVTPAKPVTAQVPTRQLGAGPHKAMQAVAAVSSGRFYNWHYRPGRGYTQGTLDKLVQRGLLQQVHTPGGSPYWEITPTGRDYLTKFP